MLLLVVVAMAFGSRSVHAASPVAPPPSQAPVSSSTAQADTTVVTLCDDEDFSVYSATLAAGLQARVRPSPEAPPCFPGEDAQRRAQLEAGRKAFEGLSVEAAVQTLRKLVADIERTPQLDTDLAIARRARLYLAWIAIERRDRTAASANFEAVCALGTGWTPDAREFPPHVAEELSRVCAAQKSSTMIAIAVDATLRVDEQSSCRGPCEIRVPPGGHFVMVDDGHTRRDLWIVTTGSATLVVKAHLTPTDVERTRVAMRTADSHVLEEPMSSAGTDGVVMLDRVSSGVVAVLGYQPFEDAYGPLTLSGDPRADSLVVRERLADLRAQAATVSKPVWKRWWFWTGVGVIAAGATVGIIAATHGSDHVTVDATLP